jgi:thioredoxin 1
VGYIAFRVYRHVNLRNVSVTDPLLHGLNLHTPTIVYFTTPMCIPCKTRQQPALNKLYTQLNGHLQIVKVDASEQPEVAQRWGVQTAPTTFVIDAQGNAVAVNYGVADETMLKKQLKIA